MKRILVFFSLFMTAGAVDAFSQNYQFSVVDVPGAQSTSVNGINNLGQIVGGYYDGSAGHGFLYDGNSFTTIDYTGLPGNTTIKDINDSGKIVGGFSRDIDGIYYWNDFIYDGQSFTSFSFPGDFAGQTETTLGGINDAGAVAGGYYNWADNSSNGFLYQNGEFTIYPSTAIFLDVNDAGMMVGFDPDFWYSSTFDGSNQETIAFEESNPWGIDIWASGINDNGLIVGDFWDPELNTSVGFVYDGQEVASLLYPGSLYTSANGINDLGQVVGSFMDADYAYHGYIATPVAHSTVPEPSLLLLSGLGIAGVLACRSFAKKLSRPEALA